MDNVVYVLDIYKQQVGRLHQALNFLKSFSGTAERDPAGINAGVHTCGLRKLEEFHHEV